jgi:AmiR/NasT family two-component response regulator
VIDQATGVIMAQQRCTAADAFAIVRTACQNRNIKLRPVCRAGRHRPPPQPPSFST